MMAERGPIAVRWRPRTAFAARVALATSALIVVVSLTQSWVLARRGLDHLRGYLEERGHAIGDTLAREARPSLMAGNVTALRQAAEQARAQTGVVYARIFGRHGLVVVSVGTPPGPGAPPAADLAGAGDPIPIGADIWEFRVPVTAPGDPAPLGSVAVGVSLEPLHTLRRRIAGTALLFTTAFTIVAVLCAVLLARAITRPLRALAEAADALARGDFDTEVRVSSRDELGRLAESFNAMVRSLARSHAALGEKVAELERANRLKSEFLATVSHELRTPLNVIMGYAEMLAQGSGGTVSAEQRTMLEAIHRYSKLQLDLVTNVLDFARLSAGSVALVVERFELAPLLTEIQAHYGPRLAGPGVQLTVAVDSRLPELETDRAKLHEIVRNLVDNAVKFTEAGTISVVARPGSDPGRVAIEVSDTGAGIPTEDLASIFDPFHQVGASSTRRTGGVGLGLSIAKQLAEALGGSIAATSRPGAGSTFRVEVPVRLPVAGTASDAVTALDAVTRNVERLPEQAGVRRRAAVGGALLLVTVATLATAAASPLQPGAERWIVARDVPPFTLGRSAIEQGGTGRYTGFLEPHPGNVRAGARSEDRDSGAIVSVGIVRQAEPRYLDHFIEAEFHSHETGRMHPDAEMVEIDGGAVLSFARPRGDPQDRLYAWRSGPDVSVRLEAKAAPGDARLGPRARAGVRPPEGRPDGGAHRAARSRPPRGAAPRPRRRAPRVPAVVAGAPGRLDVVRPIRRGTPPLVAPNGQAAGDTKRCVYWNQRTNPSRGTNPAAVARRMRTGKRT